MPLSDLERSAHVPVEEQTTAQAEPPPAMPITQEELDRHRLLGPLGAGG
ncbi:MAG: hypothetical protein JWM64_252 [Frankiales bacterium]|nr:hypothetical protein [Frankiales bacterium]